MSRSSEAIRAAAKRTIPESWLTAARIARHYLKRFSSRRTVLNIDVADCNLWCSMCPNNEALALQRKKKPLMDYGLFSRIVDKICAERVRFRSIWFGNWGESLLNPALADMIRYAKERMPGTETVVFTNLNVLKDPDGLVRSGLDHIAISISGMTQEVYARNHCNGNIAVVLENVRSLIRARDQQKRTMRIRLRYHRYLYNAHEEQAARAFCAENGLEFERVRCFIPGVEASAAYHKDKQRWGAYYSRFIDLEQEERCMTTLSDHRICPMLNDQVAIDTDGRLYRCCAVYAESNLLGSIFDQPIRRIHEIRSPICLVCAKTPVSWRW
ncbi:MAG: hypothetical protein PHE65_07700 [Candidatus Omnitrophica bacterium]|nr:hypothetical protein [Candidatus Omnitrophota bacterium]